VPAPSSSADLENDLPEQWEPPRNHQETQLQAEAIQNMLWSSISPPDTPTRRQNRANVTAFTVLGFQDTTS
jgi:hypothetical protein